MSIRARALPLVVIAVFFAATLGGCQDANIGPDLGRDFSRLPAPDLASLADLADAIAPDLVLAGDLGEGGQPPDLALLPSPCANGIKDGQETDVDCGGPTCGPCADGAACAVAGDCKSGICGGMVCKGPSCTDGIKNGGESDVDCGGICAPCRLGKTCVGNADCQGGACIAGLCKMATPLHARGFAAALAVPGVPVEQGIAGGDFNRDGKLDLVAVTSGGMAPALALFTGRGDGTFAAPVSVPIGNPSQTLVAFDLSGDGALDVATGDTGDVEVFLNDGKGTLRPPVKYGAKVTARSIDAADCDGDGMADLVWVDAAAGAVSVLYGTGGGAFGKAAVSYTPCAVPKVVLARDLDDDQRADLVVACGDGRVLFMRSLGASFGKPNGPSLVVPLFGAIALSSLAAGDWNGDGETDIAVTDAQVLMGAVLINRHGRAPLADAGVLVDGGAPDLAMGFDAGAAKDGGAPGDAGAGDGGMADPNTLLFAVGQTFAVDVTPRVALSGDWNGDGFVDIAVGGAGRRFDLLSGAGDGSFGAAQPLLSGHDPSGLAAGDWNGDGKIDLAVANVGDESIQIHLQKGGGLTAAPAFDTLLSAGAVVAGDWNGDGKVDLCLGSAGGGADFLAGGAHGVFAAPVATPFGSAVVALAAADLDGDGLLDLVASDVGKNDGKTGGLYALLGTGAGTFTPTLYFGGTGMRGSAVGDWNSDGRLDVAATSIFANRLALLVARGKGVYAAPAGPVTGRSPFAVASADLDRDGNLDLAVANFVDGTVTSYRGSALGTFQPGVTLAVPSAESLAIGDLNGDGHPDLVAGSAAVSYVGAAVYVMLGKGDGSFGAPIVTAANRALAIALGDFDLDGNVDAAVAGGQVLGVLYGTGDGRFQAPLYYGAGLDPNAIAAADLDGDDKLDIAVGAFHSGASVVLCTSH